MNNENNKQRGPIDEDLHNTYKRHMDTSGLKSPSDKAAHAALSGFLSGMASSIHKSIVNPNKGSDFYWLLKRTILAVLIIGSVLLLATVYQLYFQ